MPLNTPKFWYESESTLSQLLYPASLVYLTGQSFYHYLSNLSAPYRASVPVICLGNVTMGGSGKTPTALAIYDLVIQYKIAENPVFLTRGYGGDCVNGTIVDLEKHTFKDVGDEALLLARKGPTVASVNRAQGAKVAEKIGGDLIIMDDGFQNPSIHKDINLLVVDSVNPFGNGQIFPAGPLREPIARAFKRAEGIVTIGKPMNSRSLEYIAYINPIETDHDREKNYVAFAGLGRPQKFKDTLDALGYNVVGWHAFPDHHPYTINEIENSFKEAKSKDALVITTEKDLMRIPKKYHDQILTLPIELKFKNSDMIVTMIKKTLELNKLRQEENNA